MSTTTAPDPNSSNENSNGDIDMQQSTTQTSSSLLLHFKHMDSSAVDEEMKTILAIQTELNALWEAESAKYEESMTGTINNVDRTVPRRNYFNPAGIVQDTTLFPYHDFLYPLIDAYDCLYDEGDDDDDDEPEQQPLEPGSIRPFSIPILERRHMGENFMVMMMNESSFIPLLASPQAMNACVFPQSTQAATYIPSDYDWTEPGEEQQGGVWIPMMHMFFGGQSRLEVDPLYKTVPEFPLTGRARALLLLRVFRHAMSELQRDYYLAAKVISRLAHHGDLDDPDTLRRLLIIFDQESINCGYPCPVGLGEEHVCSEWAKLVEILSSAIGKSISVMSNDHAVTLAACVKMAYFKEFGHFFIAEGSDGIETKRRTLIKRNVVALRSRQDEDLERQGGDRVNVKLVCVIVQALVLRASLERTRCKVACQREGVSEDTLRMYIDSFWNCYRALVEIGEITIATLPDSERFYEIASHLVRSLTFGMMDATGPTSPVDMLISNGGYVRPSDRASLIAPRRYMDPILHATELKRTRWTIETSVPIRGLRAEIMNTLQLERPEDVRIVVRGLFIADVVDVKQAGVGYGDFLLWSGYEINPHDPVLFWESYAYPVLEEGDESEEEEDDDSYEEWVADEAGHELSQEELHARYSFTLMSMMRAWQAPWTPESHSSFQPGFRKAVKTLVLSTHHLHMPAEIALRIVQFLNRDWWPDERRECWSYACQVDQEYKLYEQKRASGSESTLSTPRSAGRKPLASICCPGCEVAWYCSKACQDDDFQVSHKGVCGLPPFQKKPSPSEYALYQKVFKDNVPQCLVCPSVEAESNENDDEQPEDEINAMEIDKDVEGDDENDEWSDEGSWESIESGEEADAADAGTEESTTKVICKFFDSSKRIKES